MTRPPGSDWAAVIVAGGRGARMGGPVPKQFLSVAGKPLLVHTLEAFAKAAPSMQLILVLPGDQFDRWKQICSDGTIKIPHKMVAGGKERTDSVRNGVASVDRAAFVAVHDGVRALVEPALIMRCVAAAEEHGSAIPVIPLKDSLRALTAAGSMAVDRQNFRSVQTPQCFRTGELLKALNECPNSGYTDEATLMERNGHAIHLVDGEAGNIKVTMPEDLLLAEAMLERR